MPNCPYCSSCSRQYKHGKTSHGSARYRCSACGVTYTDGKIGKLEYKQQAVAQFREIRNVNVVCDQLKVSRRDLIGWSYKEMGEDIVQSLSISKDINQVCQESGIPVRTLRIWYKRTYGDVFGFVGTSIVPNEEIICPYCKTQGKQLRKGVTKTGLQRYFCSICHHTHTPASRQPKYSDQIKRSAVEQYKRVKNYSKVAKYFSISKPTLTRWVKDAFEAEENKMYQDLPLFQKENRMDARKRNRK